jgi:hypothetical protein
VLFFEAPRGRRQIRRVHQGHRVRLAALAAQQAAQQMLINLAQSAYPQTITKLMEHARAGQLPAQVAETPPGSLFGQLGHQQVERMGGGEQRQQMHPPQLGRTQGTTPPARELAGRERLDEVIGHERRQQFQQPIGAGGRKKNSHARTLTGRASKTNPPKSAKPSWQEQFTRTFGTPSTVGLTSFFFEALF